MATTGETQRQRHRDTSGEPGYPSRPAGELAAALAGGPFPVALDTAIRRSGLTLEAVQRRMAVHGAKVSQATLSYWRRGQRTPAGDRSLHAVQVLEHCLGLPRDALARFVGPGRASDCWPGGTHGAIGLDSVLQIDPGCLTAFDGLDLNANGRLSVVSLHAELSLDAHRREQWVMIRISVISKVDGADRWVCFLNPKADHGHRPMLTETQCCRLGRIRSDAEHDLLGAELRFDYPLRTGDSYVFAYRIEYGGTRPYSTVFQQGMRTPVQHLLLQVHFQPDDTPVRYYQYHRLSGSGPTGDETEISLGGSRSCHILMLDAQPGIHGIRWEWD